MFIRLVARSFVRNPLRKLLGVLAVLLGIAVSTTTLTMAIDVGDRLAAEFRGFGANILVRPVADSLPLEVGGVDYRPVDEGAWLAEADLGKLKTIFWRHNIVGFTPFLELPVTLQLAGGAYAPANASSTPLGAVPVSSPITLIGSWYQHDVAVPDGTSFRTGLARTHPWWDVRGSWFSDGAAECVVGDRLAARLGIYAGEVLRISSTNGSSQTVTLTVAGILSTGGAEDDAIVAPLAVAQQLSGHPGQFRTLFVSAITKPEDAFSERNPATMSGAEYDRWYCSPYISSIGRQIQQVLPGTEARPIRRIAETEGRILTRVSGLFWLVTLAALAAAMLAISAISVTSILERRSEIGLLKALGARNGLTSFLILGESALLALVGGLAGYVTGTGLARLLGEAVFGAPSQPRLIVVPVVLGLALAVTILGSALPLRQAAQFDPAAILRGE
jgi:putative ABC transport system permease protein